MFKLCSFNDKKKPILMNFTYFEIYQHGQSQGGEGVTRESPAQLQKILSHIITIFKLIRKKFMELANASPLS